jgi:hypothetical protein
LAGRKGDAAMIRSFLASASIAAALALAPVAASAQEEADDDFSSSQSDDGAEALAAMGGLFGSMFGEAEPLTAEQEARVPAADKVVAKLFPPGSYAKMMDETMAPMMEGVMSQFAGTPELTVAQLTGIEATELSGIEQDRLAEVVQMLDPAAQDRNNAIAKASTDMVTNVMNAIEPAYRAGLTRAYAKRFTVEELSDLSAYFATPVGSKYAAESFLIYADPQVMESMNQMMPAMFEMMPKMLEEIGEITVNFPQPRTFSSLSAAEKARVAQILGRSEAELIASEPVAYEDGVEAIDIEA